jgi:hypothetical protein
MATNASNVGASIFIPVNREEDRTSLDSMITLDMSDHKTKDGVPYDFQEMMKQKSYYLDENDRYVALDTEVNAVYKLLSIYVPRRKSSVLQRQAIGNNSIASQFINFNQLPLTISGLSELNSYPVKAPPTLRAGSSFLRKRSVVVVEIVAYQSPNNPNSVTELVTSSSAIVYKKDDPSKIYYYNPTGVVNTLQGTPVAGDVAAAAYAAVGVNPAGEILGRPNPIMEINANGDPAGVADLNASYLESRQGTLFFYEDSA